MDFCLCSCYSLTFIFSITEQPGGHLQPSSVFEGGTLGKLGMVCSPLFYIVIIHYIRCFLIYLLLATKKIVIINYFSFFKFEFLLSICFRHTPWVSLLFQEQQSCFWSFLYNVIQISHSYGPSFLGWILDFNILKC